MTLSDEVSQSDGDVKQKTVFGEFISDRRYYQPHCKEEQTFEMGRNSEPGVVDSNTDRLSDNLLMYEEEAELCSLPHWRVVQRLQKELLMQGDCIMTRATT